MTDDERLDEVILAVVREVAPWRTANQPIGPDTSLADDLGMDSLGLVALAFRLSEELGIDFEEADGVDLGSIETVADVRAAVLALRDLQAR